MNDYIHVENLIDNIRIYKGVYKGETITFDAIAKIIENQPLVDAVEVVRCRDCKHSKLFFGELVCENCSVPIYHVDEDFFCKWGEKNV